jgi:hypothetical protein
MSIDNHSSQFVWPTGFSCTIVSENKIVPNSYSLNISIVPVDNSPGNISTGYRKIGYFVDTLLHNSILIYKDNPLLKSLADVTTNIVLLPTEPYDYFVGSVLYRKFLSITEKYFHIDVISVDSSLGDHINYSIMDPEECGLDLQGDHWWNQDSAHTGRNPDLGWGDLAGLHCPRFEPRIIKGGRSED